MLQLFAGDNHTGDHLLIASSRACCAAGWLMVASVASRFDRTSAAPSITQKLGPDRSGAMLAARLAMPSADLLDASAGWLFNLHRAIERSERGQILGDVTDVAIFISFRIPF